MRTLAQIRESIEVDFMRNEALANMYGFAVGGNFSAHFSRVSVESLLIGVFASAAWVLENMFSTYRAEIEARIEEIIPHRPKWYRDKTLAYMKDMEPVDDTDYYDTSGMNDADIAAARVIKHVVAVESDDSSILTIKVASEDANGQRIPLDLDTETHLKSYLGKIKDAGVRINLVNQSADIFNCVVDIYHNPMIAWDIVESNCTATVKSYIENLPLNGEYTNMALIDRLQAVEGVVIPELQEASISLPNSDVKTKIIARYMPAAGYFTAGTLKFNMIPYA